MKKIALMILVLFLVACKSDDDGDSGCRCQGKYQLISLFDSDVFFYSDFDEADCESGEPIISQQQEAGNPAIFIGCVGEDN